MKEQRAGIPLISIIIATLNAGQLLQGCLDSITALHLTGVEIVVADGGSTDQTLAIVSLYKELPVLLTSGVDSGIYDAYNKGIALASGRWLYFLGADDRLLPGFRQMAEQLSKPDTVYYGDPQPYYSGNDPGFVLLGGKFSKYRLAKFPMNHQSILYPSAIFQKYLYETEYRIFADYALTMQVWGDPAFQRIYLPLTIVQYHMNGFSSSLNDSTFLKKKNELIKVRLGWLVYIRYRLKRWKKQLMGEQERK